MTMFTPLKTIFKNNLAVIIFYALSFHTFTGLKEIPNLLLFSFNLQMIIVYFYVLKFPDSLGLGHIFLAGIINDVVIGTPLGTSSFSFLLLSFFTTYIRGHTLRPKMSAEWTAFIPALFVSNFSYFIIINNFSHLSFYYIEMLRVTFFTYLFFPFFYYLFIIYETKILKANA